MGKLFQVVVTPSGAERSVPITAGHLEYATARVVADGFATEHKTRVDIIDEEANELVYTIEPLAENVIPLRGLFKPQGVEHGTQRD